MNEAARVVRSLASERPFLLVARCSLVMLLVVVPSDRVLLLFAAVATAVLFLQERLLQSPWPWLVIAAVLAREQFGSWWVVDDHEVATTYWILSIGLSRFSRRPDDVLRVSARMLIVALFAFAFGWKLLSDQYVSGDFFEYTLLRDSRFEPVVELATGIPESELVAQRAAVSGLTASGEVGETVAIETSTRSSALAHLFTYYGLAMEGGVFLSFAFPLRGRWRTVRHVALITFCLTTYSVVPVTGFGLLLLSMGMAQAHDARWRLAYLGAGVAVFAWTSFLVGVLL